MDIFWSLFSLFLFQENVQGFLSIGTLAKVFFLQPIDVSKPVFGQNLNFKTICPDFRTAKVVVPKKALKGL